ncbi:pentapeptide repeat-containing protein [Cyanobacteria bacterium FACHB-63]|nr:pentapeptide repeat-containing protein [Cyanobacteria bacterium FACHB-63]
MQLNFSGKNLQGRSFQGQDLTGASFQNANVSGANLSNATLIGANFTGANAGLQMHWRIILYCVVFILVMISGAAARFSGGIAATYAPGQAIALITLVLSFIFIARRGITADFATLAAGIAGSLILTGVGAGVLSLIQIGDLDTNLSFVQRLAWTLAGTLPWALAGALSIAISGNLLWILTKPRLFWINVIPLGIVWTLIWQQVAAFFQPDQGLWTVFGVAIAILIFSVHSGWRAFQEHEKFVLIRWLAVEIAAQGGTSFRGANLTEANFAHTTLKGSDFTAAILTRTNFHKAEYLDQAKVNRTILVQAIVRALLVTHRGAQQSYRNCDLSGANLIGADLREADFTEADLSEATLAQAELDRANLTRVQALKTNFERSRLTGTCLESWNIDRTTRLDQVRCDYVYLLNPQQERRPSSGNFAAGEFTKLFQVAINTIDLIFQNGVDWKAFITTARSIQVEHEDVALTVRSIENKEDGVVIVKVNAPETLNKATVHAEFMQTYAATLEALEQRYQAELNAKNEQIVLHQQHQADLKQVMQWFTAQAPQPFVDRSYSSKRVVLKLSGGVNTGFAVTLQIGLEGALPQLETIGQLPPAPELLTAHRRWQSVYRKNLAPARLEISDTQITNISHREFFKECHDTADQLQQQVNRWLNSELFRSVKETLLEQLIPSESIQIILQTEDYQLRQMPLQLWDFFDRYPKSEITLSTIAYQSIDSSASSCLEDAPQVKILAVLGDSTGIDLEQDQALLKQLPNADVTFLVEPQRQALNDQLWTQAWDILFFAGHSSSHADANTGHLFLNRTEPLTIPELKHGLRHAIAQGLKLAIFNSCDGLGLATDLADLHLPHLIVMREPVPDRVAQEFLKHFLAAFAAGKPLYRSMREARERLQGLEDQFPCATWLPVLCQNPAAMSLTWQSLSI